MVLLAEPRELKPENPRATGSLRLRPGLVHIPSKRNTETRAEASHTAQGCGRPVFFLLAPAISVSTCPRSLARASSLLSSRSPARRACSHPKEIPMFRKASLSAVAAFVALGSLVVPVSSAQAITVSRATLKGGVLSLDGTGAAPGIYVTVLSSTSFAGARSSYSDGSYHIQATNFRTVSGRVVVSDRHTLNKTVTLSGCTPISAPTPIKPAGLNPNPSGLPSQSLRSHPAPRPPSQFGNPNHG